MKQLSRYLNTSLKKLLICYIVIGILVPLTLTISILFIRARQTMIDHAISSVNEKVSTIARNVDDLIGNVHSVSDKYAYDNELEGYTSKFYGKHIIEKRRDMHDMQIMFTKGDFLNRNVRISAIITEYKELMNFLDPICDHEGVKDKLYGMGIDNKSHLSKMIWYPLQNDFLAERKSGYIRTDKVVIGSRRIIDPYIGKTKAIHLFALRESDIWEKYYDMAKDIYGDVYYDKPNYAKPTYAFVEEKKGGIYIINSNGELISSSAEKAVEEGKTDEALLKEINAHSENQFKIMYRDKWHLACKAALWNTDWQVVSIIPIKTVTQSVDKLFLSIIIVAVVCIILCLFVINYIAKRFLEPIDLLNNSMEEVYNGNMQAYVEMKGHGEIQRMGQYYNAMLRQINFFINEKVETEKKKKQLEMEVLMGQINPHFLYNTLETIVWKSSEAGRPDIGRIAASLGRLYRLSISNGDVIVKIQQEIEHLMTYINIQKVRYKERMDFDLVVNYEDIREYKTIKLILQPAIENCFMYAMEGIDHPLKIRLRVNVLEKEIRFIITDNGCGLSKEALAQVMHQIKYGRQTEQIALEDKRPRGTGIGLHSISERIKLYFGQKDAVKINSKENIGTVVTIIIPKRHD